MRYFNTWTFIHDNNNNNGCIVCVGVRKALQSSMQTQTIRFFFKEKYD